MRIEIIGSGIRIHAGRSSVWLTAQEVAELFRWTREHEQEMQVKAVEAECEQRSIQEAKEQLL